MDCAICCEQRDDFVMHLCRDEHKRRHCCRVCFETNMRETFNCMFCQESMDLLFIRQNVDPVFYNDICKLNYDRSIVQSLAVTSERIHLYRLARENIELCESELKRIDLQKTIPHPLRQFEKNPLINDLPSTETYGISSCDSCRGFIMSDTLKCAICEKESSGIPGNTSQCPCCASTVYPVPGESNPYRFCHRCHIIYHMDTKIVENDNARFTPRIVSREWMNYKEREMVPYTVYMARFHGLIIAEKAVVFIRHGTYYLNTLNDLSKCLKTMFQNELVQITYKYLESDTMTVEEYKNQISFVYRCKEALGEYFDFYDTFVATYFTLIENSFSTPADNLKDILLTHFTESNYKRIQIMEKYNLKDTKFTPEPIVLPETIIIRYSNGINPKFINIFKESNRKKRRRMNDSDYYHMVRSTFNRMMCGMRIRNIKKDYDARVQLSHRLKQSIESCNAYVQSLDDTHGPVLMFNGVMKGAKLRCLNEKGCRGLLYENNPLCMECGQVVCFACKTQFETTDLLKQHRCNKETLESIEKIKKTSKPCPQCGVNIEKIEGCNDMFCIKCKTGFEWNTLKLKQDNRFHNIHLQTHVQSQRIFHGIDFKAGLMKVCPQLVHHFFKAVYELDYQLPNLKLEINRYSVQLQNSLSIDYIENRIIENDYKEKLCRFHRAMLFIEWLIHVYQKVLLPNLRHLYEHCIFDVESINNVLYGINANYMWSVYFFPNFDETLHEELAVSKVWSECCKKYKSLISILNIL